MIRHHTPAIEKPTAPAPAAIESEGRRHRYAVGVRPDGDATFECLVVDCGGDSGGYQEAAWTSFGEALTVALRIINDPDHVAFGAPLWMEARS
jgi:hypothetical protein